MLYLSKTEIIQKGNTVNMSKLRIGIIGTGNIGVCHMNSYKAFPDRCEVVAVCDIYEEKAKAFAEKYGVKNVYTDAAEMMKNEQLDAVSVCTWNSAHKDATITALNGGANVICEKPMAMNTAEALEMYECAKNKGKLLMLGFVRRHGADAKNIRDFINGGVTGDIYYAKATYLRRSGCPGGWFGDKDYSGGGPLIDLGVHVIDLVRYLGGNPKPVSAFGVTYKNLGMNRANGGNGGWLVNSSKIKHPYTVEDFASGMIKFENGLTISVEASFNLNIKQDVAQIQLFGTKAGISINPELEIYTDIAGKFVDIKQSSNVAFGFDSSFNAEIKNFLDSFEGKAECVAPAEDGVELMRILDAIYESARIGKSVDIVR